jgi:hypothetical protein
LEFAKTESISLDERMRLTIERYLPDTGSAQGSWFYFIIADGTNSDYRITEYSVAHWRLSMCNEANKPKNAHRNAQKDVY